MSKIFLFVTIFYITTFAQTYDSLFVTIASDTVRFWNYRVNENCGSEFTIDYTISNNIITLIETVTSTRMADCICFFNLSKDINELSNGNYVVKVYRLLPLYFGDSLIYIGETSFNYFGNKNNYGAKSYQSNCYFYEPTEVKKINKSIPEQFSLSQNFPNPFNPSTIIQFTIPQNLSNQNAVLIIYNLQGEIVNKLLDENLQAGTYLTKWNGDNQFGNNVSSGIYFYEIKVGKTNFVGKMNLIK
jgi:hypothetical protein